MSDLDKALADLADIRSRLAAGSVFQGFGPAVIAITGAFAFITAAAQTMWPGMLADSPERFLMVWVAVAILAAGLICSEVIARSRRRHGGMATPMIINAAEQFIPAGAAGAALMAVFLQVAPEALWLLPGLWSTLVSLGLFAAARCLPRTVMVAAGWYFLAGVAVILIAAEQKTLSPWMMGAPFGVGQLLLAAILHFADGDQHGR